MENYTDWTHFPGHVNTEPFAGVSKAEGMNLIMNKNSYYRVMVNDSSQVLDVYTNGQEVPSSLLGSNESVHVARLSDNSCLQPALLLGHQIEHRAHRERRTSGVKGEPRLPHGHHHQGRGSVRLAGHHLHLHRLRALGRPLQALDAGQQVDAPDSRTSAVCLAGILPPVRYVRKRLGTRT